MENTRTEKTARRIVAIRALALASVILLSGRVCAQQPTTVLQPEHVTILRHDTHRDSEGTFQYDADGALVQYHEAYEDDDHNEYNISYDEEGNVSVIERKIWGFTDDLKYPYLYGRRYLFSYDALGRIDRMEQLYHDVHNDEYWVSDKLWTPIYDDDGRLAMDTMLAVRGSLEDDMPYEFLWHHDHAFGDGTRETLYTNYVVGGSLRTIKVAETYTEDGKLSTAVEERLTNETFVNNKRWDYTYNGGLVQSITKLTWDGTAWQNDMLTLFTYDADGNLTMKESLLWDGESFGNDRRTRIVLNEAGLPQTVLFEQWDNGSWTEGTTDGLLPFVGDHILGKRLADFLQIQPNPTAGVVTLTGKDISSVEVHNTLGQRVLTKKEEADTMTLDLTGQPSGLYFISVTDQNGQRCVKKIVKQ